MNDDNLGKNTMMNYRYIKNSFAVAGVIIFSYIFISFLSGSPIQKKLYGTWNAIEIHDQITFTENNYIRGDNIEEYKIRANKIILASGEEYKVTLTKYYLQLNDIFYLKR